MKNYNNVNETFFCGQAIHEPYDNHKKLIYKEIFSRNAVDLLNQSNELYAEDLTDHRILLMPVIDFQNYFISSYESYVSAINSRYDDIHFDSQYTAKLKDIIVFNISFSGDIQILKYKPNSIITTGKPVIRLGENELQFEYVNWFNDKKRITDHFDTELKSFQQQYNLLKSEIDALNRALKYYALNEIIRRKEELTKQQMFLESFNLPLKKRANVSITFSAPAPILREKIRVSSQASSHSKYTAVPVLDNENYHLILKMINDVGKNFERMPSVYKGKNEETLRDHILLVLDPNFEMGSAGGETFHMTGKTDISLRYDSSVVFVAECKFWHGTESYHQAIDQLLGYLTWRDSKTALIIFVPTQEFSMILNKIVEETSLHQNFLFSKGSKSETWFECIFSLPLDKHKEITINVLVFHLPGDKGSLTKPSNSRKKT